MGDIDLRYYLSLLWRRLPYIVVIVFTGSAISVLIALHLPPVYRASGKILVETPNIPADMARSTVSTNAFQQLQIIQQQVTARENLLALANKLNVYRNSKTALSSADIVENMRKRTTFEQGQLETSPYGQGVLISAVSFEAANPVLAADMTNEIMALIVNKDARRRTDRAGDTMQFFDREVAGLTSELARLEADILKFRNTNKEALPESLDFRRNQQSSLQERLLWLEREEAGLRSRRDNIVRMQESSGRLVTSGPLTLEQQVLHDLDRTLYEQLAIYSEESPNIVALRARIGAMQQGLRSTPATDRDGDEADGTKKPSEIDFQLSDIEERLRFIAEEKSSVARNITALSASITATPRNETILKSLERDRVNTENRYNEAVAKLADASRADDIETRSKGVRFSIVEKATPPEKPVSPHRRRIAATGTLGAAGLGFGVIMLFELLNRTIRRPVELAQMLEVQPLATIPYIWTTGETRARRMKRSLLAIAAGGGAAAIFVFHYYFMPLGLVVAKLFAGLDLVRIM